MSVTLVTIEEYSRQSGVPEDTIRWLISSGEWIQGVHYHQRAPRCRIMIDIPAVEEWWKTNKRGAA